MILSFAPSRFRLIIVATALVSGVLAIGGCGQRGPLYFATPDGTRIKPRNQVNLPQPPVSPGVIPFIPSQPSALPNLPNLPEDSATAPSPASK